MVAGYGEVDIGSSDRIHTRFGFLGIGIVADAGRFGLVDIGGNGFVLMLRVN